MWQTEYEDAATLYPEGVCMPQNNGITSITLFGTKNFSISQISFIHTGAENSAYVKVITCSHTLPSHEHIPLLKQ